LIGRVPAAEVEALVMTALRNHLQASGTDPQTIGNERELVEYHLEHVTLTPKHIKLQLRQDVEAPDHANDSQAPPNERLKLIAIPWKSPVSAVTKGIIHVPVHNTPMKPSRRDALLTAIATARQWVDALAHGRDATLAVIARREGIIERHVRLLLPLAFVSPRILSALLDGTAPAILTATTLARALPRSWAEQERRHLHRPLPGLLPDC
jgi:site-specific DNA recombinase